MPTTKFIDLHGQLDYESPIKTLMWLLSPCVEDIWENTNSEYTQDNEEYDLKEVPISVVCDLEEYELAGTEGVHCLCHSVSRGGYTLHVSRTASVTVATSAQKNDRHMVLMEKVLLISSIENITPPMGAPNATATPAALDAVMISRILPAEPPWARNHKRRHRRTDWPWLCENLVKKLAMMLPMQHAMWTEGPSLPTVSPDAMMRGCARVSFVARLLHPPAYQCDRLDYESREAEVAAHDDARKDALNLGYPRASGMLG
jgi:hypothetical protein